MENPYCSTIDEINPKVFNIMKNSGLFLVYLGIETGTDHGLHFMNKHMKVETSIKAVSTLKILALNTTSVSCFLILQVLINRLLTILTFWKGCAVMALLR